MMIYEVLYESIQDNEKTELCIKIKGLMCRLDSETGSGQDD